MKNKFINLLGLLLLVSAILVSGCKKDDDEASNCVGGAAATISGINPGAQIQTGEATISGSNLNNVNHVFVGQIEAEIVSQSDGSLTFTVPLSAELGDNAVTLAGCDNKRATTNLTVNILPAPIITSITPWVPIGGELIITGTSLENNAVVTIDGVEAAIVSTDGVTLVATVPDGVPDDNYLDVVVTNDFGTYESPIPFFARENLLANGDFTSGSGVDIDNWEKLNGAERMNAITGDDAFAGGRSLMVDAASGNPWDNQLASDGIPLEFGEDYSLLIWGKAIDAGAFMRFSISQFDGNGADYFYGEDKTFSGNWEAYSWSFNVTNDLSTHRAVLDMGASTGAFMIDHVALVKGSLSDVGGPAPNLAANGSFEDGLNGWEQLNGTFENSTDAKCGSSSLTATGVGGNPWDVQLASDPMDMVAGNDYEISFWAKAAAPDGFFRISMSQYNGGDGSDFFYSDNLMIPEDWTYYSFVLEDVPQPASGVYRLLFDMGESSGTFFVDEVSVREYEYSQGVIANGEFEDLSGWETLNGTHEISTDAHTGSGALTASGVAGNPWDVQLASDHMADIVAGNDYKISFWAKGAAPDGFFRISMSQYNGGDGSDFFYSDNLTIPEDWTYFSFVLEDVPAVASGVYRLLFDMGESSGTFFVDDVAVVEYEVCE